VFFNLFFFSFYSGTKLEMMEQIRKDIRDFKTKKNLDKVGMKRNLWCVDIHRDHRMLKS